MAEAHPLVTKGHNLRLLYEFLDPDADEKGDIKDRWSFIQAPILYPHFQVRMGYRDLKGPVEDVDGNANKVFAEAHFLL